jgi:hypothetical protein
MKEIGGSTALIIRRGLYIQAPFKYISGTIMTRGWFSRPIPISNRSVQLKGGFPRSLLDLPAPESEGKMPLYY